MPVRTLVGILIQEVSADQAEAIRKNLDAIQWAEEWWGWEHHPQELWLRAHAKVLLDDPEELAGNLDWLAHHVWDATEEFAEAYLMLNPAERGQRTFVADDGDYAEYQQVQNEVGAG